MNVLIFTVYITSSRWQFPIYMRLATIVTAGRESKPQYLNHYLFSARQIWLKMPMKLQTTKSPCNIYTHVPLLPFQFVLNWPQIDSVNKIEVKTPFFWKALMFFWVLIFVCGFLGSVLVNHPSVHSGGVGDRWQVTVDTCHMEVFVEFLGAIFIVDVAVISATFRNHQTSPTPKE